MNLLSVRDLHVHLGQAHVLHGLSFDVPEGAVTALLGRNGVGKTTTLRSLVGLVGREGAVDYAGESIAALPTHRVIRRGIGYVPEDREIFAGLTVEENLRLAERAAASAFWRRAGKAGTSPGSVKPTPLRYDLVYDLFPELRARGRQRAGTLSGGQQQMLTLGRALVNDNRLLLVAEPTKGLSPLLVTEVAKALERIREHTTVLLVEQNLGVVRHIAEHVVVLDQGRVVHTGPAQELLDDRDLVHSLLGVA
ncbi:MAG TPA: ABC transporter ATP-binding protein [Gaiellaceae bacterium]|nr:ABC transporter ATP-binding protein [Gaiellaceae bacterium]